VYARFALISAKIDAVVAWGPRVVAELARLVTLVHAENKHNGLTGTSGEAV